MLIPANTWRDVTLTHNIIFDPSSRSSSFRAKLSRKKSPPIVVKPQSRRKWSQSNRIKPTSSWKIRRAHKFGQPRVQKSRRRYELIRYRVENGRRRAKLSCRPAWISHYRPKLSRRQANKRSIGIKPLLIRKSTPSRQVNIESRRNPKLNRRKKPKKFQDYTK